MGPRFQARRLENGEDIMKATEIMKLWEDDVFKKHQLAIAKRTLKAPDAMVAVMGGMDKDEARRFLKSIGWSDEQIANLEK